MGIHVIGCGRDSPVKPGAHFARPMTAPVESAGLALGDNWTCIATPAASAMAIEKTEKLSSEIGMTCVYPLGFPVVTDERSFYYPALFVG